MSKAFTKKRKASGASAVIKNIVPIFFFLMVVLVVLISLQNVKVSNNREGLKVMEQGVRRAAVQCYAIEGKYPQNLEYLSDNYGLLLDDSKYVYHYQLMASNMMPEIKVFDKAVGK